LTWALALVRRPKILLLAAAALALVVLRWSAWRAGADAARTEAALKAARRSLQAHKDAADARDRMDGASHEARKGSVRDWLRSGGDRVRGPGE